jgi:G:T-mismatch repair DNA endonuclease (very short patch repair protein)
MAQIRSELTFRPNRLILLSDGSPNQANRYAFPATTIGEDEPNPLKGYGAGDRRAAYGPFDGLPLQTASIPPTRITRSVFPARKMIIFVNGCFWHRHGKRCPLTRLPKSRLDFWLPKLEKNRIRDDQNRRRLRAAGWRVLTLWECQLRKMNLISLRVTNPLKSRSGHERKDADVSITICSANGLAL